MGYRIKYDINTAVSIPLIVAQTPDGDPVEQEVVYLPGAVLPSNFSPRLAQAVDDGEEHISKLVEYIDTGEPRAKAVSGPLPQQQPQDKPGAPFTDYPASSQAALAASQESAGGVSTPGEHGAAGLTNPFVGDGTPRASAPDAPTSNPEASPYADLKRADLDAELAKRQESREVEVTGTGANGNVTAPDIVRALEADDAAQATAS
jgi:hypothetical protein